MAADPGLLLGNAVLEAARLPVAVMSGTEMLVRYANPAFCQLVGKSLEQVVGMAFKALMPDQDVCLYLLQKVYREGKCDTHTEQEHVHPNRLFWSYEAWPTWDDHGRQASSGVVLQVTEAGSLHRQAGQMSEALLLAAVRQHELVEAAELLNTKLVEEIEDRLQAEREVQQLAFYDPLTSLPNRRLLLDRLHHANLNCHRTLQHGALLFIDLDRFKSVNDTLGHHMGDLLLQQVAQRLRGCVRENDTVARIGGDEFVVMLENLSADLTEAQTQTNLVGEKILATLGQPYRLADYEHHSAGSIGIGMFGRNRESVDDLLRRADLAQYRAKHGGGGRVRFFTAEMEARENATAVLEADLRLALQRGQFRLYYQVQVDEEGKTRGVEALLRWQHPERGLLLPGDFIKTAEKMAIVEAIGSWVLEAACLQLREWSRRPELALLTIAINVSAREFGRPDFIARTLEVTDRMGTDGKKLMLEITEDVMLAPLDETRDKMTALKAKGIRFALDAFGTGNSSFACLRNLALSQVKIERSFVGDVLTSYSDSVIVGSVIAMGESLGLTVVAEGVETEEQHQFLARHGCRAYQGFLFGRPVAVEQVEAAIVERLRAEA